MAAGNRGPETPPRGGKRAKPSKESPKKQAAAPEKVCGEQGRTWEMGGKVLCSEAARQG